MAGVTLEEPKPKQKKESYFSFGDDQAPVTLPYIPSWLQQTQVMYSKLPMLHAPSGTITLFTTGLCEKLHFTPSDLEFDCSANEFFLEYKSLHDPHLKNLYCQARTVRRLINQGFITPELKVKCSLEDFNIYHQYLKKMKLNRLNQKQKRQLDQGREEKLNQAKRKKEQPSERDRRGAAARERKAAKVKEEHQRLLSYLERDAMKRAKLLKERQLQRGIMGAQKSLQKERRRIAHIALDLQERQRKALILQKRTEKEEGCARRLAEQKERNKAERERKLAAHWAKQEILRRRQMREQATQDERKRRNMQQKIEWRKQTASAKQMRTEAEFLKIRDERAKHCQDREKRIERALKVKLKKVCSKYEKKSTHDRPVSMSFPPIDKGFKGRGSVWSSVETSLQTTSLDPATGVWNYPPAKRHKVSSPSVSSSSQLSTSSTVLPPIIMTSDFSGGGDDKTETSSIDLHPESSHQRTDLSDTEDSTIASEAMTEGAVTVSASVVEASRIVEEIISTAVAALREKTSKIELDIAVKDGATATRDGIAITEDSMVVTEAIPASDSKMHAFAKTYVKQDVIGGLSGPVNDAAYGIVVHTLLDGVYKEIAEENPEMVNEDGDFSSTDDLYLDLIVRYNEMNSHVKVKDSGTQDDRSPSIIDVSCPKEVKEGELPPVSINQMAEEVVRQVILSVFLYLKTTGELLPESSFSSLQVEGTSGTRRSSESSSGPFWEGTATTLGEKIRNIESISELFEHLPSSAAELYRSSQESTAKRTNVKESEFRSSSMLLQDVPASRAEEKERSDVEEEGEDEEVIGIVENEIIAEELSMMSVVLSYGELSEVFREKEDGSLMIEGAIDETVLDAPGRSLTETVLSIESLHRNKSGQQTSSSSCHLNKSAAEGDEEGSGEATGIQYHSVIPVHQTTLITMSDDLISRNLSLISSKPEGDKLAGAHQLSGRNSFRNMFRPDITYCVQSLQSIQSMKKSVEKNQGELGFLEEEEELNRKDSKEKVIMVEETEGVCYLPKKKTYQVTYDSPTGSIRSLNKEMEDSGDDSSPSAERRKDSETRRKRKRKSKKRRQSSDMKDSSDESGSQTRSSQDTSASSYSRSSRSRRSGPSAIHSQESDTRQPSEKAGEVDKRQMEKASSESAAVSPQEKSGSVASVLDSIVAKISQLFGSKKDVSQESVPSVTSKNAQLLAKSDEPSQPQVSVKDETDISPDDKSSRFSSDEQCDADVETEGTDQMGMDNATNVELIQETAGEEIELKEADHEKLDHVALVEEAQVPSSLEGVTESADELVVKEESGESPQGEERADETAKGPPSEEKVEESIECTVGDKRTEECIKSVTDHERNEETAQGLPHDKTVEGSIECSPGGNREEESSTSPTDQNRSEDLMDGLSVEENTQKKILTAEIGEDPSSQTEHATSLHDKPLEDEVMDIIKEEDVIGKTISEQESKAEKDLHALPSPYKSSERDVAPEPSVDGVPTKIEGFETDVDLPPSSAPKDGEVEESVSEERGSRKQVSVSGSTEQDNLTQEAITKSPSQNITDKPTPSSSKVASSKQSSYSSMSSKKSSSHTRSSKKSSSVILPSNRSSSVQTNLKSPYSKGLVRSSSKVGSSKSCSSTVGVTKRSSTSISRTKRSFSLDGPSKKTSVHAKSPAAASKSLSQTVSTKSHSAHVTNLIPNTSEVALRSRASPHSKSSSTLEQTSVVKMSSEVSCKSSPCVIRDKLPASSIVSMRSLSETKSSGKTSPKSKTSIRANSKATSSSPHLKANKSSHSRTDRSYAAVKSTSLPIADRPLNRLSKGIVKSLSVKGVQKGGVSSPSHRSSFSSRSSNKSFITPEESQQMSAGNVRSTPAVSSDETHNTLHDESAPVESDLASPVTPVSKPSVETTPVTVMANAIASPMVSEHASVVTSPHMSPVTSAKEICDIPSVQASPVSSDLAPNAIPVHSSAMTSSQAYPVSSPKASIQSSPVTSAKHSPVQSHHESTMASDHTSPLQSYHISPVASVHESSVPSEHKSSVASDSASPVESDHTSPVGSVHLAPVTSIHTSPVASDPGLAVASDHTSPVASEYTSPVAPSHISRMPSHHTSEVTHDHELLVASDQKSPVASDPSEVASSHVSQVPSDHTSAVTPDHESLVASDQKSPVASDLSGVASGHVSQVPSDHASAVTPDHESLVASDQKSPVTSGDPSPVASDHCSPVASGHLPPVASDHNAPVELGHVSQVPSDHTSGLDHKLLLASDQKSLVVSVPTSPVASDHKSSLASDQKFPLETGPQSDNHSEENATHQPQKSMSHVQKKKSSLLSIFRRGSITKSRSETSDVMKIVQIARRSMSDRSRRSLLSRSPSHGLNSAQEEQQPFPPVSSPSKTAGKTSSEAEPGNLQSSPETPAPGISPPSGTTPSKSSLNKQSSNHSQTSLSSAASAASKTSQRSSHTSVTSNTSKTSRTSRRFSGSSLSKRTSNQSKTSVTSNGSKKGLRSKKSSRSSVYEVVEE